MTFEILVRPATAVPVLKQGGTPITPTSGDDEAVIEWGRGPLGMVERSATLRSTYTSGPGFDWEDNFPDTPPPDEEKPEFVFDEISRKTHVVRVSNPTNPENYVDVSVIDVIAFEGPNGIYIFRFTNEN
jgi:hypothetical protein